MKLTQVTRWAARFLLAAGIMTSSQAMAQNAAVTSARPEAVLYDQTDNAGVDVFVDSSDPGSLYALYATQAADDFKVPNNAIWKLSVVTASGRIILSDGSGVSSVLVQIYANGGSSLPTTRLYSQTVQTGNIGGLASGVFVITLTSPMTLGPGHYWLAVQPRENCTSLSSCKHWVWTERTVKTNLESVWQNPLDGFHAGCATWKPRITVCDQPHSSPNPDLLFKLEGTTTPVVAQINLPLISR